MIKKPIIYLLLFLYSFTWPVQAQDNGATSSRWNIVFQYAFTDMNGRIEIGEIKCNRKRKYCKSPPKSKLGLHIIKLQPDIFNVTVQCCSFSRKTRKTNLIIYENVLQSNLYIGGFRITRTLRDAIPEYYGRLTIIKR